MLEMPSGNAFDETEENGWRNVEEEENIFISKATL